MRALNNTVCSQCHSVVPPDESHECFTWRHIRQLVDAAHLEARNRAREDALREAEGRLHAKALKAYKDEDAAISNGEPEAARLFRVLAGRLKEVAASLRTTHPTPGETGEEDTE